MSRDSGPNVFQRGVMALLLLSLLRREDMYGYQLVQETERRSGGRLKTQEGSLYPVLYRLQEQGLVKTRLAPAAANGGSKKYYSLTDKGRETLEELAAFWREYAACVDGFLQRWKEESP